MGRQSPRAQRPAGGERPDARDRLSDASRHPLRRRAEPAAVLLGGENIAVSAARSLGRAGVRVHALGVRTDPVRRSRFCADFVDVGDAGRSQERYLDWLLNDAPGPAVVLPCDDDGLELVARHRARIEELGHVAIEADDAVLLAMLDKARTYALAAAAGIPAPRWALVRTQEDAAAATGSFEFPCALKPLHSHHFSHHFGVPTKVFIVESADALRQAFARTAARGIATMVTEIVPGSDDHFHSYYSYLDPDGEPLFHFTKRKLRQWPTHFGLGSYHVTDWNEEVAQAGLDFFRGVGLRGLGNVEFKRDERDGRLKVIDCNARFTAANEVVRRAGLDLPLFTYNRLTGRPTPEMASYRTGVRLWHPIEDVRALRQYRRRGELTAPAWARSLMHRQHFPLLRIDDPLPSAVSLATKVRRQARKRVGRPWGLRPSQPSH